MRFFISCILFAIAANAAPAQAQQRELDLLVVRKGWGGVKKETVERVLYSTSRELWKYFPDRKLPPIIVQARGGPITLFQRGPGGEIFMRLDTGEAYWAQYAYQFSHEFCHVLCNYDEDKTGNKWLEESICELASMFTIRRMAETWKTDPPFDHWKGFSKSLKNYSDDLLAKSKTPNGRSLAQWYAIHADELHNTANNRKLNSIVAHALLPLFEESPEHWQAVTYLNAGKPKQPQTLKEYLSDWHVNAPQKHQTFIRRVAAEFGIEVGTSATSPAEQ